jgi:hypothetical protein
MLTKLDDAVVAVRDLVLAFETERLSADDAAQAVERFAELERLAVAGRTLAGRRVERSKVWREQGFSTPARWMAAKAQTTVSDAIATIETGRRLEQLPQTSRAVRSGLLSGFQAAEISAAATADPSSEGMLLENARTDTVSRLREQCRSVVAAASRDADADERIHRSRYLRSWSEPDGAVRLDARLTSDAGAKVMTVVRARSRELEEQARRAHSRERREAHDADALVSLADPASPHPRAVVHVHVDRAAWNRGRVERNETCRIPGVGPISVAAARRLARDGVVKAILREGADVRAVANLGRTIPARLRTALEVRDTRCVVPGCDETEGLEIDHVMPLAEGGPTSLDNLARLCRWHHSQKTHRGWQLTGGPGRWEWFRQRRSSTRRPRRE